MNANLRSERGRNIGIAFAAGALMLCGALANFLNFNDYPFFRPEVALVAAGLLCVAIVMTLFYTAQRQWGRSFLEGVLALVFVDLSGVSLPIAIGIGCVVALVSFWRRTSLLPVMAVIGALVLITKVIGIGGSPGWIKEGTKAQPRRPLAASAHKPAILHIILDEQVGTEGLREEGPEGQRLADYLRDFYVDHGFALYGGAYSEHMHTVNAIPSILNYGERLSAGASTDGVSIGPTRHLQNIVDSGYRLTVLQSDFAEYCTGVAFSHCVTYDSSSLHPTLAVPLRVLDRAGLIALKFLSLSDLVGRLSVVWNLVTASSRAHGWNTPRLDPANDGRSSSVASLAAFDELTGRLRNARPGDAIFAHMLLPHYPYVVRADCSYLPWRSWKLRSRPADIQLRRRAYYAQVRCAHYKIAAALQALSQSTAGRSSIVIIHGDHGSRITAIDPMEPNLGKFGDADMVAGFSTLFAVRAPGVPAGYSSEPLPAPTLLRDFARSGFRLAPHPEPVAAPSVYLDDRRWRPTRRVNLPRSWLDSRTKAAVRPRRPLPGQGREGRVSH